MTDFGAKGDGVTDDTAALQAAISAEIRNGNHILYLPAGTYLVSSSLFWKDAAGNWQSGLELEGAGEGLTTIKLVDDATGFGDPTSPQSVIDTASMYDGQGAGPDGSGNGGFRNLISDLTVDVGSGNPGAIGINELANNVGGIRNVTVTSSDPALAGVAGISVLRPYPGPLLISNVTIHGFAVGLDVGSFEYSLTVDGLSLSGQTVAGVRNQGNTLAIQHLQSVNSVPAVINDAGGFTDLLDSNLSGGTATAAIENSGLLYVQNVVTSGYQNAIDDTTNSTNIPGGTVASYSSNPSQALNTAYAPSLASSEPPAPVDDSPDTWAVIPWSSGDSTAAIQAAIDSGATTIAFASVPYSADGTGNPTGVYHVSGTIYVRGNVERIVGLQSTIFVSDTTFGNAAAPVPVFSIETSHAVMIQGLTLGVTSINSSGAIWFQHDSSAPLVLQDVSIDGGSALGYKNIAPSQPGALYIDDSLLGPIQIAAGQSAWARQLNIETTATKIVNAGNLWILGYKTEESGTELVTTSSGTSEVYGGFFFPNEAEPASAAAVQAAPGASQFLSFVQEANDPEDRWSILIQEAPGQSTVRDFATEQGATRGFGYAVVSYGSQVPASNASSVSAQFVGTDQTTQGNWTAKYGSQGYVLGGTGVSSLPSYATVNTSDAQSWTWANPTSDPRGLLSSPAAGASRVAATWFAGSTFHVSLNLSDAQTHSLALYFVDWDGQSRSEEVSLLNSTTGAVLDQQSVSQFSGGVYLVWNVSGPITIQITNLSGSGNVVLSGLFLSADPTPTASYVGTDTTTQGTWKGAYGGDGFDLDQDPSGNNPTLPAYASLTAGSSPSFGWTATTNDPRALQVSAAGSTGRMASAWYSATNLSFQLNINDGQTHRLALYAVDWDGVGRQERVSIVDTETGVVLDSETLADFQNGAYLVWNVSGDVTIRVTNLNAASNAVLSGIFLGGASPTSASFVGTDHATEGQWSPTYGLQGYALSGSGIAGNPSLPAYATLSMSGAQTWTWANSTTDPRALATTPTKTTNRQASAWFSSSSFSLSLNLTDGQTHRLALYALDWDKGGRSEQISLINTSTGAVLDQESISNFANGVYLVWNVSGAVTIQVTNLSTTGNAVLSGLFLDGQAKSTASYVGPDTTTKGNWTSTYGKSGYAIDQDPSPNDPSLPSYATLNTNNTPSYTWAASTTDTRALRKSAAGSTDRVAASWYTSTNMTFTLTLTDGQTHQLALYLLDWDNLGRSESISIIDTASGQVLDTRTASRFGNGTYFVWNVRGNVTISITNLNSSANAVLSGIFLS